MSHLTFVIPGPHFGKQRARMTRHGNVFTQKETVSFERVVGQLAALKLKAPLTGPLKISIAATFQPPKSWSKKKTAAHLGRYHTQRPDTDYLAKAIRDGLNRIAYADDAQLAWIEARKLWGPTPQTVVHIERLSPTERSA